MSSVDDVVRRLRERAEQRLGAESAATSAGTDPTAGTDPAGIPPGRSPVPTSADVRAAIAGVAGAARFDAGRIATTSRSRAGTAVHRLVAQAVARQTAGVLAQVEAFAAATREALEVVARRADTPGAHTHPLLAAQVDAALDRLAAAEPYGPDALIALRQRVEALEATLSPTNAPLRPWWAPDRWLDEVDGTRAEVVERRRALVGYTGPAEPVLDVACGRGEMLEALREAGLAATGAESDPRLLGRATAAGLRAVRQSPITALGRAGDGALGTVVALGVVERLGAQGSADLVGLAADRLAPGGRLLVESADPAGARVWADPGARRPQEPEWLIWICGEAGFATVEVERAADRPPGTRPGSYLLTATMPTSPDPAPAPATTGRRRCACCSSSSATGWRWRAGRSRTAGSSPPTWRHAATTSTPSPAGRCGPPTGPTTTRPARRGSTG